MTIATATGAAWGGDFHAHILTDMYLDAMADARNNAAVAWSLMPAGNAERVAGKYIKFPIHTTRNMGTNAIRPGDSTFPRSPTAAATVLRATLVASTQRATADSNDCTTMLV